MISEIEILEDFVVEKLKPAIEKLKFELEALLKKAELTRRNGLVVKTSGTSIGVLGTVLSVGGVCLAPFTLGASSVLTVVGLAGLGIGGVGAVISGGTSLVEGMLLQKKDKENLQLLMEAYETVKEEWDSELEDSEEVKLPLLALMNPPSVEEPHTNESIQRWLNHRLFVDKKIRTTDEIRTGDHIYRYKIGSRVIYHHGVFLGEVDGIQTVVDFGASDEDVPVTMSIDVFIGARGILYKRDYRGFEIPVQETLELASTVIRNQSWNEYNLLENNCEHFATFLKLKILWSSQVEGVKNVGVQVLKGVGKATRTVQAGVETAETVIRAAQVAKASASIWPKWIPFLGNMGSGSARTLGAFSKTTIVLAPIMTAVDIGMLIHDFKTKPESIQSISAALEFAEKNMLLNDQILEHLKTLKMQAVIDLAKQETISTVEENDKTIRNWMCVFMLYIFADFFIRMITKICMYN